MLSRLDCYELCVQSPRHVVALLRGVHGNEPLSLREDFCGTAAVSRRWLSDAAARGERAHACAIDLEPESLAHARDAAHAENVANALTLLQGDCITDPPAKDVGTDVIFVGNFSLGYIHTRELLVRYLSACKRRLDRGNAGFGGGIFACDLYGGPSAFRLGALERKHPSRGREIVHYLWQHEAADPRSGMVINSISFRVVLDGEVVAHMPRAFVYEWRLWSIAELGDAARDAGFSTIELYTELNIAPGHMPTPLASPDALRDDWIALVVMR